MAYFCPKCNAKIFVRSLGYCSLCREVLPEDISTAGQEENYSRQIITIFSQIMTKFDNLELLIESLKRTGLEVHKNTYIRGESEKIEADVVSVLKGKCDIGFINKNGMFILIADLACVNKNNDVVKLMKNISMEYERLSGRKIL